MPALLSGACPFPPSSGRLFISLSRDAGAPPPLADKNGAQEVSSRLAKYDDCFVDAMVAEGIGSFATPLDEGGSIREGLVTFAAFALCGLLPLLAYALSPLISAAAGGDGPASQGTLFLWACLVTAAALFAIGVVKVCSQGVPYFC